MSLFLDQKYLSLISARLPFFKRKDDHLYNCRCILCGDSTKNKRKARGYFFHHKNELRYKCHNCDASLSFGNFLKQIDAVLYSQYALEKYAEGNAVKNLNTSNIKSTLSKIEFEQPKFKSFEERLLDKLLDRLDSLPDTNEAVQYCIERNIPRDKFNQLYFIENIKDIEQLSDTYKDKILTEEPRLVLPFYDDNGQLTGVTCRALRGEKLRYVTVKIQDDVPLIFGNNNINNRKLLYVVEGPIDSLFIDNCIAVAGTGFNKISSLNLNKAKTVLVFDNQPRNKEVCKIIEKNIDSGYNVVIWPQNIEEKDINEMVLSGKNIKYIISNNTYKGLAAKAKFIAWKRC